ncbi:MAG: hypothetical protein IPO83_18120 [Chitinophagaceae bacterium]|nr:hypothetical protein [Chitinophagaceae bacterium]
MKPFYTKYFRLFHNRMMLLSSSFFLLCFILISYNSLAQTDSTDDDLRIYNSADLFFVANSKANGTPGLLDPQIQVLDSILAAFSLNYRAGERNVMLLVCNGLSNSPPILTNYKAHDSWIRSIREDNSYLTPQFQFDKKKLQKFLSSEKYLARSINVYYFFSVDYLIAQYQQNNSELSRYINVLPRQLATLLSANDAEINIHIYIPSTTGQVERMDVDRKINSIAGFKSNDPNIIRTNVFTHVN